ncbi:MAG: PocR ligand-binding domain-containing protein [Oscillospiraceae bacterium]|nr:PocR ligand-binding domain-containing protein [Oscillospiraceae bacterium]
MSEDNNNINEFEKLVNVEYIKKLQSVIWDLFGFSFYIANPSGGAIIGSDKMQPICKIIRSFEKGKECCDISDAAILGDAKLSGKMICRKCMAVGLTDAAIPLFVHDEHIATLFFGQINSHGLTAEAVKKFAKEIGADEKAMVKAYNKMQFADASYFERVLELMKLLAQNISEIMEANSRTKKSENENLQNSEKIYMEYDIQIFMNKLQEKLFRNSDYTVQTLDSAALDIKEFLGFDRISVYRDISGIGAEFVPDAGDIDGIRTIKGADVSVLYGVEKYGFTCCDGHGGLNEFVCPGGDYITVALPIFADRTFSGFISMSIEGKKRIFTVSEINLFKNIAAALSNFYYRIYAETKLKKAGLIDKSVTE